MLGLLGWVSNVVCGGAGHYLFLYYGIADDFYFRDINVIGFVAGFYGSILLRKGIRASLGGTDTKSQQTGQATNPPKENSIAIHSTLEDAGFCLKCGHDSLWATITHHQGKEERALHCSYCDAPPETRATRSDRMMND